MVQSCSDPVQPNFDRIQSNTDSVKLYSASVQALCSWFSLILHWFSFKGLIAGSASNLANSSSDFTDSNINSPSLALIFIRSADSLHGSMILVFDSPIFWSSSAVFQLVEVYFATSSAGSRISQPYS